MLGKKGLARICSILFIEPHVHVGAVAERLKPLSWIYLLVAEERMADYRKIVDKFTWPVEPGKKEIGQYPTTREDYEFLQEIVPEETGPKSGRLVRAFSKIFYPKAP